MLCKTFSKQPAGMQNKGKRSIVRIPLGVINYTMYALHLMVARSTQYFTKYQPWSVPAWLPWLPIRILTDKETHSHTQDQHVQTTVMVCLIRLRTLCHVKYAAQVWHSNILTNRCIAYR